tara:strand:- start:68 stop:874 length:807 start_codon:yes stop_codon:yes gene_type:complete
MDTNFDSTEQDAKAWSDVRDNLEIIDMLREKVVKKNNGEINSKELREWLVFKLKRTPKGIGHEETKIHLIEKVEKNLKNQVVLERIDFDTIDFLEDCCHNIQVDIEARMGDKSAIIDKLNSSNIGNKKILDRIKNETESGKTINDGDFRYILFCLRELKRQNIFETGIVPDGWLHTEFDNSGNEEAIMELRHQIEKNTKYVKWGAYAYFHDRLKRQKTLFNYKSENIWAVKKLSSENKGSGGIPICSVCGEHLSNAKFCGKCGTEAQT